MSPSLYRSLVRRPSKLVLTAIFLLVLGTGNILVGTFKVQQYDEVSSELEMLIPESQLGSQSILMRIHSARRDVDRLDRRRIEVNDRRSLYRLVVFGGKIFIAISTTMLLIALSLRLLRRFNGPRHRPSSRNGDFGSRPHSPHHPIPV